MVYDILNYTFNKVYLSPYDFTQIDKIKSKISFDASANVSRLLNNSDLLICYDLIGEEGIPLILIERGYAKDNASFNSERFDGPEGFIMSSLGYLYEIKPIKVRGSKYIDIITRVVDENNKDKYNFSADFT